MCEILENLENQRQLSLKKEAHSPVEWITWKDKSLSQVKSLTFP